MLWVTPRTISAPPVIPQSVMVTVPVSSTLSQAMRPVCVKLDGEEMIALKKWTIVFLEAVQMEACAPWRLTFSTAAVLLDITMWISVVVHSMTHVSLNLVKMAAVVVFLYHFTIKLISVTALQVSWQWKSALFKLIRYKYKVSLRLVVFSHYNNISR